MDLILGFIASKPFDDEKNFPYGLSKSGIFSIPEAEMLAKVGNRLSMLEQGVTPENQVEENFIQVCQGAREASTLVEMVWQKYKKNTRRQALKTLGGSGHGESLSDSQSRQEDMA